jgi:hypothetical protein
MEALTPFTNETDHDEQETRCRVRPRPGAGLSGCATQQKSLYGWGNYQDQLYEHFKTEGNGNAADRRA